MSKEPTRPNSRWNAGKDRYANDPNKSKLPKPVEGWHRGAKVRKR